MRLKGEKAWHSVYSVWKTVTREGDLSSRLSFVLEYVKRT